MRSLTAAGVLVLAASVVACSDSLTGPAVPELNLDCVPPIRAAPSGGAASPGVIVVEPPGAIVQQDSPTGNNPPRLSSYTEMF